MTQFERLQQPGVWTGNRNLMTRLFMGCLCLLIGVFPSRTSDGLSQFHIFYSIVIGPFVRTSSSDWVDGQCRPFQPPTRSARNRDKDVGDRSSLPSRRSSIFSLFVSLEQEVLAASTNYLDPANLTSTTCLDGDAFQRAALDMHSNALRSNLEELGYAVLPFRSGTT